jgi:hypothetical protein
MSDPGTLTPSPGHGGPRAASPADAAGALVLSEHETALIKALRWLGKHGPRVGAVLNVMPWPEEKAEALSPEAAAGPAHTAYVELPLRVADGPRVEAGRVVRDIVGQGTSRVPAEAMVAAIRAARDELERRAKGGAA